MPYDAASQKQLDYLDRLVSYRLQAQGVEVPSWKGYPCATSEQVCEHLNTLLDLDMPDLSHLTKRDASRAIEQLKP